MFVIDVMSRVPVYEQIINQVEEQIMTGILKEGDKMPSVRSLSVKLSTNPNTIQKAYSELDRRQMIVTVPGKGSFIEGVRPFLVETQALVSTAAYGTPQRSATGFDQRRLNMLLAVLEKRVGFKLMQKDVFLNIAGGLRVTDPAMDLSVLAAVLSSNVDTPIEQGWCMAGEVGLSGEVRPVSRIEQRIAEAEKLGFQHIIIPKYNNHGFDHKKYKIEIHPVRKVEEAFRCLFG